MLSASEFCTTSSPNELRNVFQESATPETKALVTQVMSEKHWKADVSCVLVLFLFLPLICLFISLNDSINTH